MKIEQAYSLDSNETVDAELAYNYYWAGIIKKKRILNVLRITAQSQSREELTRTRIWA